MATAAGIVIATGGITLVSQALTAQYVNGQTDVLGAINWRVIPATVVAALFVGGVANVNEPVAKMLAYLGLATVLFTNVVPQAGTSGNVLVELGRTMGYSKT
jgi:hypothetical protein